MTTTENEIKSPEALVQAQLEEWAATDPALAEKFNPEKIGDCWKWITEKAREALDGESGAIRDEQVFRWGRDYFVDDVAAHEEEEAKAREEARAAAREARRKQKEATEPPKPAPAPQPSLQQLDLFGGLG